MTTKDLGYNINLVDEAVAGFERIDSNFRRSSMMGKILSNSIPYYRASVHERKNQSLWQNSRLSYFRELLQLPQSSETMTLITVSMGRTRGARLRQDATSKEITTGWKAQVRVSLFQKHFKIKVKGLVAQPSLTLCDSTDCSPPGSPVHSILQARILEWVAIPFSRGSSALWVDSLPSKPPGKPWN